MDNSQRKGPVIQNTPASACKEGLPAAPEAETNVRRSPNGEMTAADQIRQIRKEIYQEGKEMHDGNSQI